MSIELAGILEFQHKDHFLSRPSATPDRAELDRGRWLAALSRHMNITAEWFVVHDTGAGFVPRNVNAIIRKDGGVHMFMSANRILTHHDLSRTDAGAATQFEHHHREFRGKLIHVELEYPPTAAEQAEAVNARREHRNPREIAVAHPPEPLEGYNYGALAMVYIFASYRARQWLTVTCHLEVDRGIDGAHHDPRGFSFTRFYNTIIALMGGPRAGTIPPGSTFGILDPRLGDNLNYANLANTFPVQYGPILDEWGVVTRPR